MIADRQTHTHRERDMLITILRFPIGTLSMVHGVTLQAHARMVHVCVYYSNYLFIANNKRPFGLLHVATYNEFIPCRRHIGPHIDATCFWNVPIHSLYPRSNL